MYAREFNQIKKFGNAKYISMSYNYSALLAKC